MAIRVNGEMVQLAEPNAEDIFEVEGALTAEYRLTELDQVDPAGRYRTLATGDTLRIERAGSAAWATVLTRMIIDASGHVGVGPNAPGLNVAIMGGRYLTIAGTAGNRGVLELADNVTAVDSLVGALHFTNSNNLNTGAATRRAVASLEGYITTGNDNANGDSGGYLVINIKTDTGSRNEKARFVNGGLVISGTLSLQARTGVIGISVGAGALVVGSVGSLIAPVSTDVVPTDALFGDVNGAIGLRPTTTRISVRLGGSWVGVAVTGYAIQGNLPVTPGALYHPLQIIEWDNRGHPFRVDEARCFVCGEKMQVRESITFYGNRVEDEHDLHAIFGHPHLELDPVVLGLEGRVKALEERGLVYAA